MPNGDNGGDYSGDKGNGGVDPASYGGETSGVFEGIDVATTDESADMLAYQTAVSDVVLSDLDISYNANEVYTVVKKGLSKEQLTNYVIINYGYGFIIFKFNSVRTCFWFIPSYSTQRIHCG